MANLVDQDDSNGDLVFVHSRVSVSVADARRVPQAKPKLRMKYLRKKKFLR
jgi:hypothetical protein